MNHSPDNFSDSDWDNGDLAWSERDWRDYLRQIDRETLRFADAYFSRIDNPDRLDAAARDMGWDCGAWAAADEEDDSEGDFYTLHLHPALTASRALFDALNRWIDAAIEAPAVEARALHALSRALARAQDDGAMALYCSDAGELPLAVCHLKRVLNHLNAAIAHFCDLGKGALPRGARPALFDLRELYLRLLADCRNNAAGD